MARILNQSDWSAVHCLFGHVQHSQGVRERGVSLRRPNRLTVPMTRLELSLGPTSSRADHRASGVPQVPTRNCQALRVDTGGRLAMEEGVQALRAGRCEGHASSGAEVQGLSRPFPHSARERKAMSRLRGHCPRRWMTGPLTEQPLPYGAHRLVEDGRTLHVATAPGIAMVICAQRSCTVNPLGVSPQFGFRAVFG